MSDEDSQNTEFKSPQEQMARLRGEIASLRRRLDELSPPIAEPAEKSSAERQATATPPPAGVIKGSPADDSAARGATAAGVPPASPSPAPTANALALVAEQPRPPAPVDRAPAVPAPWAPARRARNGFHLALHLAQRPGFCCCCLCLQPRDARRARRIFAIVRAVERARKAEARRQASLNRTRRSGG